MTDLRELPASTRDALARIPRRYRDADVTTRAVRAWVDELITSGPEVRSGRSLLIVGPTGVGKTWEAYGALRSVLLSGAYVAPRDVTAGDLYAQLRPRFEVDSEEVFTGYARARLLFLDDLGSAKPSEWTEEVNHRLVNHRYQHELATIFTTNLTPKEIPPALGDRVASRLTEMCELVVMKGADLRVTRG